MVKEVIMRYLNKIGGLVLAIVMLAGMAVVNTSAQVRVIYRRPIVAPIYVRDPFWYDRWAFYHDPYYFERQRRYNDQQAVNHYSKKMAKDREKGDMAKLAKDTQKYNEALDRLNRDS
jgi:hypothetical protein